MKAWCPNCKTWTDTKFMKLVQAPDADYYVCNPPCKYQKAKQFD